MTVKDFDLRATLLANRDAGSEHPKCRLWHYYSTMFSPDKVWAKGPWFTRVKMAYYSVAHRITDDVIL